MDLSVKHKARLENTGPSTENLTADFDLSIQNLFDARTGESTIDAFNRNQKQILEGVASFFSKEVFTTMVSGFIGNPNIPQVTGGLSTRSETKSNSSWNISNDGRNISGKLHMEATLSSNYSTGHAEALMNARGDLAANIATQLLQQLKLKLYGHKSTDSTESYSTTTGPDGVKFVKYADKVQGRS